MSSTTDGQVEEKKPAPVVKKVVVKAGPVHERDDFLTLLFGRYVYM